MACKVVWSDEAINSFEIIIDYLKTNFTEKEILSFIKATNDKLRLIENNPLMCRQSLRFRNVHFTNILQKVILVYRFKPHSQVAELIHFWDGRRNPKRFRI